MCGLSDLKITLGQRQEIEKTFYTVPLTIEASATTDQVVRFVKLFETVDLLHRLVRFQAVSPTNDGNPLLTVTIVAEGVSMHDASTRPGLFPQTTLVKAIGPRDTELVVKSAKAFTGPVPFLAWLNTEFLLVTAMNGDRWTVERGAEETAAQKHDADTSLELFPLRPLADGEEDPRVAAMRLVANKLFTKPTPNVVYRPRFTPIPAQRATRGSSFTYQLKVEGWDPSRGKPVFSLEPGAPAGMTIEGQTGAVKWTPADDLKPGKVEVIATAASPTAKGDPVSASFTVDVRPANHAPSSSRWSRPQARPPGRRSPCTWDAAPRSNCRRRTATCPRTG
ncbi:MAG: putative Ig domain-containing protein [Pirellulales bacterium]